MNAPREGAVSRKASISLAPGQGSRSRGDRGPRIRRDEQQQRARAAAIGRASDQPPLGGAQDRGALTLRGCQEAQRTRSSVSVCVSTPLSSSCRDPRAARLTDEEAGGQCITQPATRESGPPTAGENDVRTSERQQMCLGTHSPHGEPPHLLRPGCRVWGTRDAPRPLAKPPRARSCAHTHEAPACFLHFMTWSSLRVQLLSLAMRTWRPRRPGVI